MSDEHFAHRCELFDAADMRIAEFADEDLAEWNREMRVSDGEFGSEYDSLAYHCDTALMALEPMPDLHGEDHQ